MTTLEHEIANLSSYVGIMKVRFGETFDVAWRIGEDTKDLLVLKMILQPIMENAILHGISPAGRRGMISSRPASKSRRTWPRRAGAGPAGHAGAAAHHRGAG